MDQSGGLLFGRLFTGLFRLFRFQPLRLFLGLAHGQALLDHGGNQQHPLRAVLFKRQDGPGVAGTEFALLQQLLFVGGQVQQAQGVGHVGAALAQPLRQGLLGVAVAVHQVAEGLGLLQPGQVLALQVFDQRQLGQLPRVQLPHQSRHLFQPRGLGRPPAAFAGGDHIAALPFHHHQGLHDPVLTDGGGQLLQLFRVEELAGLVRVGPHAVNGQLPHLFGGGPVEKGGLIREQGRQAPAQSLLFSHKILLYLLVYSRLPEPSAPSQRARNSLVSF